MIGIVEMTIDFGYHIIIRGLDGIKYVAHGEAFQKLFKEGTEVIFNTTNKTTEFGGIFVKNVSTISNNTPSLPLLLLCLPLIALDEAGLGWIPERIIERSFDIAENIITEEKIEEIGDIVDRFFNFIEKIF
ncbi:hypothetical protein K8R66_03235 [bacterium]|nr:hypothetical protein [bacterium]